LSRASRVATKKGKAVGEKMKSIYALRDTMKTQGVTQSIQNKALTKHKDLGNQRSKLQGQTMKFNAGAHDAWFSNQVGKI